MEEETLKKMTVAALQKMCRDKGLRVSGRKQEIIDRLTGAPPAEAPKPKVNAAICWAQQQSGAKVIRRNAYGNFEDPETHFVFNRDTKQAIGKQEGDKIVPLTPAEIRICQENKWLL